MRQSTRGLLLLPARSLGVLVLFAVGFEAAQAQARYRVVEPENFRRDPSSAAPVLATVPSGTQLSGGQTQDGWTDVTLEGWIWAASVEPTVGGDHDLRVTARGGENLRSAPNRTVVARLSFGTLLDRVERDGQWMRVRRRGWMWGQSLSRLDAPAPARSGNAAAAAAAAPTLPSADAAGLDRAVMERATSLHQLPNGDTVGMLAADAPAKILARSGDWVRVQVQGWVRESDLRPFSPGVMVGVSGAEVRAVPDEYTGKLLQWTVQYISVQEADELRSEMPLGQPYMLARGPLPEAGFVYVVVTDEQRARIERLPPLAELVLVGRVRTARSRFLGNTILDLIDLAERQP